MQQKTVIPIIFIVLLVCVGIFLYAFGGSLRPNVTAPAHVPTPVPTRDVTPVPVTIQTVRGKLVAVTGNNVSLEAGGKTENFTLTAKTEVYHLTGGTLEGGNAQTKVVTAADLAAGQEVLIVADKNSTTIQRIVIVK